MFELIQPIDDTILLWIQNNLRSDALGSIIVPLTRAGDHGLIFIIMALVALIFAKTRRAGAASAVALILSAIFVSVIMKPLFARPRPYEITEGLSAILTMPNDPNSFPSGHTAAAFALATAWLGTMPDRWIGVSAFVFAFLMGFSRIYVAVHNPSDVVCGAIVGIILGMLAVYIIEIWENRKKTGDGESENEC